ncbi:MAG: ATP-dependent helicase HrpB [Pseudomonadota bacterium]
MNLPDLPVTAVLPDILVSLADDPNLVLVAPPGAGKTTLVPLALLDAPWREGRKIIMLEPRRMAARGAAARMAHLLGENVGERVGYRVRFDTKVSKSTVIEVVTEGVFTRMLASDPALDDVACVLFDEFHERSLDGDLALALALDLQAGLREDLRLMAMSATLDGAAVAGLMKAQVLESEGRTFPVEITYREPAPRQSFEGHLTDVVIEALATHAGDILVFLPGQREIEQAARVLESRKLGQRVFIHRLYGALSFKQQQAALKPSAEGARKIVLASAIAETSLTIEGVTLVIDSGLARKPLFEPSTGLSRLQTTKASKAAITQRAGRAGRLAPGTAMRLWREPQTAALPAFDTPEILNADLTGLVLDLAHWGVLDGGKLHWLDRPPAPAVQEARQLLARLNALELNPNGTAKALTSHGRAMANFPLHPRLAHMLLKANDLGMPHRAALLALLAQERGRGVDLTRRADAAQRGRGLTHADNALPKQVDRLLRHVPKAHEHDQDLADGTLLGFAYPDRIARRSGKTKDHMMRYKLANGRAADLPEDDELAGEEFLTVVDMMGKAGRARITAAAALPKAELEAHFSDQMEERITSRFVLAEKRLECVLATQLGELTLSKPRPVPVTDEAALEALDGALEKHGLALLPWQEADRRLRGRLALLHARLGEPWPAMEDEALLEARALWLHPFMVGATSFAPLAKGDLSHGLMMLAAHTTSREIDALLPSHFCAPSGSRLPLDYGDAAAAAHPDFAPVLRARPQELFGLDKHPTVLNGKLPLAVELLSPAGRPIQITRDLPGFWRGSWSDVRADLRGRYLKHPWPEDPLTAPPAARAKPRGT